MRSPPASACLAELMILALALASFAWAQLECRDSLFNFSVPFFELAPGAAEQRTRLVTPVVHPAHSKICNSMSGALSCCSETTLVDFTRWSDALDFYEAASQYIDYYIETDARVLVDQIILKIKAALGRNQAFNWKVLRNGIRDEWGALITSLLSTLTAPTDKVWSTVVTYQEGLLCSSCVPNFSPLFLNVTANQVNLQPKAALDIAHATLLTLDFWDKWFADGANSKQVKEAVIKICTLVSAGSSTCRIVVPSAVSFVLNAITKTELKIMLCGKPSAPGQETTQCVDMIMNKMLNGLAINFAPVLDNVIAKLMDLCNFAPIKVDTCTAPLIKLKEYIVEAFFDSFDDRPTVSNVYSEAGFDVFSFACASHLSGYACGGQGWPLPDHSGEPRSPPDEFTDGDGLLAYMRHLMCRPRQPYSRRLRM